jgi:hypothetical protein
MSIWNIGKDDVSEHTQALKDTASSKGDNYWFVQESTAHSCFCTCLEIENSGLRNQLLKRDSELNEIKSTLNETLHKVRPFLGLPL